MSSWRSLLLRIGDKCPEYGGTSDFKEHIETCCGLLLRELEHSGDDILEFLLQCAQQLPHKIPLYGTVVGLLNLENEDFAVRVVDSTQASLQDALILGDCNGIRISMRFLTALMCSKVVQPGSVVETFVTLLSSAATTVDEEAGNPSWQPRADFYISCILSCLPWGGADLFEQVPEEIERVMVGVESYLQIRRRVNDVGFKAFESNEGTDKTHSEKDFLEDLWDRMQVLSNNEWKVDSVPKPHLSFEAQLVAGNSHAFGSISCPEQPDHLLLSGIAHGKQKHEAELKYPQRLCRLHIFPASKAENMQPVDRFVVEEYLLDVLFYFNGCRKECAFYMVGLPVPFRYEYLMAETIFSQLFLLPHPPFKPIYYTLVIIDLCKALPGAFPAVVAGAVRSLFEKIADLDMECRTRLILWFSHHLANFQFIWPWEEWAHVLDLPRWAPQRVFVQEILEREVRLSYWDKIKQSIENASALEELLPPKGGPNFKYNSEDAAESAEFKLSTELSSMVKGKKTAREIISWVDESIIPVHGSSVALEVIIQTLLDIGSKSFTHLTTVLERYGQVILKLCPDQEKQVQLIHEVSSYWKNNAQMTAIAIDRMMGYRLVSNLAIIEWVFSPINIEQFHLSDCPWEILTNAVNKTYNRITDLRTEISSLEKDLFSAVESATKAKADLEVAASKLELVNGEPVQSENPGRLKRLKALADRAQEDEVKARESIEAKEALLARACDDSEALFISLYKSFAHVLMERLPLAYTDGEISGPASGCADEISVEVDEPSLAMDVDKEDGKSDRNQANGTSYNTGEQVQWCRTTLGYVKAFSRQYATEIWRHIEKLDTEVFVEGTHLLFRKAVFTGLRRPA